MSSSSNVKAMAMSVNISIVLFLVLVYPLEYRLNYSVHIMHSVPCIVQSIVDNAIRAHGVDTFILLFSILSI